MAKLNKNSAGYIYGFALAIILVCGVLLSVVSGALSEKQAEERDLERKTFILKSAIGADAVAAMEKEEILTMYNSRVKESVIGADGKTIEGVTVTSIALKKEYKKLGKDGSVKSGESVQLPVYEILDEAKTSTEFYVFPTYGFGLWDNIWGYVALQSDLNTVQGVVLDHQGETPGLGARITENTIQDRYAGKKIFNGSEMVSITMMKGEGKDYSSNPHSVDGMSGATLTADGVNAMMQSYMNLYLTFINAKKG